MQSMQCDPNSAHRFREGDIVECNSRIWRIERIKLLIEFCEIAEEPGTPTIRMWMEGSENDPVFSIDNVRRLLPEQSPS